MTEFAKTTPVQLFSRRHFVIGSALVAASAVAFARQPTIKRPAIKLGLFEEWTPVSFGGWTPAESGGVVLPPPDELSARLYDDLVTRVYGEADDNVMMLIAYNNRQDGVLQVHRPEFCYSAGGFSLGKTRQISLLALEKQVPAIAFTATSEERTEQVLYFTRLGGSYPRSWAEQRFAVVAENLAGRIPDGLLFRVSLLSTDQDAAVEKLRAFARAFVAAAAPPLQKLLVV